MHQQRPQQRVPPADADGSQRGSRAGLYRVAGTMLGLALLAGAVVMVARQHMTIRVALRNVADQPSLDRAELIALMLVSVLANIALTAMMFRLLMSRYFRNGSRVGAMEMQALIASATLVNYLPLRPGVIGRVAYHKTVNGISLRDSAKAIVQAATLSATVSGYLALVALACRNHPISPWLLASAPLPLLAAAVLLLPRTLGVFALAAAVRLLDVLVTAVRYHAAFALIGSPIDWTGAMAFACISVMATMVPLVSNGLGLREWAIGLLAPAIASYQMELGLTADLLNRAAELVMAALAGLPATLWLARHVRAVRLNPQIKQEV